MTRHPTKSPYLPTLGVWLLLLLFAWCLAGCNTSRQTSSSICRITALSFDSCKITFAMSGKTDIHEDATSSYPTSSASSSGKPRTHNKAKPSTSKATPTPSSLTIYGLHFAQSDETKSVSQSTQSDSLAIAKQSSNDKSKQTAKAREPFTLFDKLTLIPILLFMAATIIFFIRRHRSAK